MLKVLFVCTGNACRSPAAEALMNKYNSQIEADSAGTHAYYKIVNITRDYLKQQNADQYLKEVPEDLESKNLEEYDLIVVMEKQHKFIVLSKCPQCKDKIVVWDIDDPYYLTNENAVKVFQKLNQKVIELATSPI